MAEIMNKVFTSIVIRILKSLSIIVVLFIIIYTYIVEETIKRADSYLNFEYSTKIDSNIRCCVDLTDRVEITSNTYKSFIVKVHGLLSIEITLLVILIVLYLFPLIIRRLSSSKQERQILKKY